MPDEEVKRRGPRGSYGLNGKRVKLTKLRDKHKLWDDLFDITQSQVEALKTIIESGGTLDNKDMSKLDSCYGGMKKLLEIEAQLKSDAIASMTDKELLDLANKAIREQRKAQKSAAAAEKQRDLA